MSIACLREPLEGSRSPRYLYSVAIEIVTPFSMKHLEPRVLRRVKQTILVFFKLTFMCDPLWEKVHFRAIINFALLVVFGSRTDLWSK